MRKTAILFCIILVSCSSADSSTTTVSSASSVSSDAPERMITLQSPDGIDDVLVYVEIANTPRTQQYGLMHRDHLDADAGMLFVFERQQPRSFWMKNTLIPLDVVFFDVDGKFVSLSTMEPCTADPCGTYASAAPAKYALEVNAGYAEEKGIGPGWRLKL